MKPNSWIFPENYCIIKSASWSDKNLKTVTGGNKQCVHVYLIVKAKSETAYFSFVLRCPTDLSGLISSLILSKIVSILWWAGQDVFPLKSM